MRLNKGLNFHLLKYVVQFFSRKTKCSASITSLLWAGTLLSLAGWQMIEYSANQFCQYVSQECIPFCLNVTEVWKYMEKTVRTEVWSYRGATAHQRQSKQRETSSSPSFFCTVKLWQWLYTQTLILQLNKNEMQIEKCERE